MGSAKTNFGHTETAAGVLGVLKVLACMEKGAMAKHLHMRKLNDFIGTSLMEGMESVVPVEEVEWRGEERRVAGVSSFGFSGTNAHVVLSAEGRERRSEGEGPKWDGPFGVRASGKTASALGEMARSYEAALERGGSAELWRMSSETLRAAGRAAMAETVTVYGRTAREVARALQKAAQATQEGKMAEFVAARAGVTPGEEVEKE